MFRIIILLFTIHSFVNAEDQFSSDKHSFLVELLTKGLEYPWSMEFLSHNQVLVTERPGKLRIIENWQLSDPIKNLPKIESIGQGGLLDIALDPNFKNNQIIYLSYSSGNFLGIGTEVIKAKLNDNRLENIKVLFQLKPKSRGGRHFGSRLLTTTNRIYITLGDRGEPERAQNLNDHAGSLIRINNDGSLPKDNPFIERPDVRPEIYTYGHRNIQGIASDPITGNIWTIEHGPQGGDELNLIRSGMNYGWPVITHGVNYVTGTKIGEGTHKENMLQPIHYWVPSIATSSVIFYSGKQFPAWKGNIFVSSLKFGQLARLEIKNNRVIKEERLLNGELGRIREIKEGPDGFLYLITDESNGKLFRIRPVGQ